MYQVIFLPPMWPGYEARSLQYISAVAGSDYNAVSVELTFVPGQTRLSVIVGIFKDDECEQPNEIFTGVLINTLSDPLLMVTPNVTTVTIDDELEPECRRKYIVSSISQMYCRN